jgi:hypothetical protein
MGTANTICHGLATGEPETGGVGGEIVSVLERRQRLAGMLRSAVGFRVDGPEGRVGVLTSVTPDGVEIATGLFIVTTLAIPFADVAGVDPLRRRVHIRVMPEPRKITPGELARRVRRFLRARGR